MPVPEVGRFATAARAGFPVHFAERATDMTAICGRLPTDSEQPADVMVIDVTVMNGDWRQDVIRFADLVALAKEQREGA